MRTPFAKQAVPAAIVVLSLATGVASAAAPDEGREVRVAGSDVVLKLWESAEPGGAAIPHYAVSLDGERFSEPRATSYELKLRYGAFDPLADGPGAVREAGLEAGADTNLYVVQFWTQPLEAFRAAIGDLGGDVRFFLANHAHVARLSPEQREAVERLPFVRWVGPFHPAYKLEPFLLEAAAAGAGADVGARTYNVMLFRADLRAKEAVARRLAELGGAVELVNAGKRLVRATLSLEQVLAAARWDEVAFVDRWSELQPDMDIAREIGGADFIEQAPGNYTGAGVRGEVIDIGFNLGHVDFESRPLILHTSVSTQSHGASTSGIIFGDGTGNPTARGLLPDGQGIVAGTQVMVTGRYEHTRELVESPYFAVLQSASVGSDRTTEYTTISADTDAMLFDFDILHCQSQSNAGNRNSRPQAWAKNIISGGAVFHRNTLTKTDDAWGGGASEGPAEDGRVKPDLCSFYDAIYTVGCCDPTSYTPGFGGTSGATPIICGYAGLFFDMWADGAFGNEVDPDGTVFDNRSHMTTAKAMLINTAEQYDWTLGGENADITRNRQGWGMPSVQRMYELRHKMLIVDEADLVTNLETVTYQVVVEPGEPAFKATLAYADPPGVPFSNQHRINDLSLKVTSPSALVYWGNVGLDDAVWSAPGGSPNHVDTVENVFVEDPEAGQWTVEVVAHEIVEDGHVETQEIDADFALVVSGVEQELPALFVRLIGPVPPLVPPGEPVELLVEILDGEETVEPGSETLHHRFSSGDPFAESPLEDQGEGIYLATVPAAACGDEPEFYVSARGDGGTVITSPAGAPENVYRYDVGEIVTTFTDDFEADTGWSVIDVNVQSGGWERGVPAGGGERGDPPVDADGSGQCYVTGNAPFVDLDGGPTILTSPILDATGLPDPEIAYARWFTNDDRDDFLEVRVSNDGGASYLLVESVPHTPGGWVATSFRIADFVEPTDQMRVRFVATDSPNNSVTEAAVDAIEIRSRVCDALVGDVDMDGDVDFQDLVQLLSMWGECPDCPEDLDGDGDVDFQDVVLLLSNWTG